MSKRLKEIISVVISMSFILSVTGCGKSKTETVTSKNSVEKPSKITWGISSGLGEGDGREEFKNKFKELTGVELEIFAPSASYYEKLDTAFSSGTAPDVLFFPDGVNLSKYASMGTLLDLNKYIEKSDAAKKINKDNFDPIKLNGKVFGLPTEVGDGTITYVRKDWLDQLGLKEPKNYNEFYSMLKAFKNIKAPNGATTIPMTGAVPQDPKGLAEFYQDARPGFIKKNGKWVDGFTEPNMKSALERLASAYKDGLLDPEIITNNSNMCKDKVYAGRVGVYASWAGFWGSTLEENIKNGPSGKNASFVPINPIENVKYIGRTPTVNCINAKSKNPDGIWQTFFETLLDGKEGTKLFAAGVEGVHYKYDQNKKIVALPMKSNPKTNYQKAYYPSYALPIQLDFSFDYPARVTETKDILSKNITIPDIIPVSSTRSKKDGDITKLKDTLIGKVIKGEKTAEQVIKEYKDKADENGIEQILKELNTTSK